MLKMSTLFFNSTNLHFLLVLADSSIQIHTTLSFGWKFYYIYYHHIIKIS
ncbi:hypothetical protein FM106_01975 [Brachybacterium faecium]|nr:hypothetical protein FM106_01975 [Brachybacterium faecium]